MGRVSQVTFSFAISCEPHLRHVWPGGRLSSRKNTVAVRRQTSLQLRHWSLTVTSVRSGRVSIRRLIARCASSVKLFGMLQRHKRNRQRGGHEYADSEPQRWALEPTAYSVSASSGEVASEDGSLLGPETFAEYKTSGDGFGACLL